MSNELDTKRNTGRTTRMLFAAVQEYLKNRHTYYGMYIVRIVGKDARHVQNLHNQARELFHPDVMDHLTFLTYKAYLNEPNTERKLERTFIDHFCFEERYQQLKKELAEVEAARSQWDLPEVFNERSA